MSAAQASRNPAATPRVAPGPPRRRVRRAAPELRRRRREARRRRRLLRIDLGIGLLVGVALLLGTAGLAIAALIAFGLLAVCAASIAVERRRSRHRG